MSVVGTVLGYLLRFSERFADFDNRRVLLFDPRIPGRDALFPPGLPFPLRKGVPRLDAWVRFAVHTRGVAPFLESHDALESPFFPRADSMPKHQQGAGIEGGPNVVALLSKKKHRAFWI